MKRPSSNIRSDVFIPVMHVDATVLSRSRLSVVLFAVFLFASAASAQTNIYQMRGDSNYGLYVYNVPNNTLTNIYQPYPVLPAGTNSATLAQRPNDGMLFYVTYLANAGNNPRLFQFNPATPNVAPVPIGNGLGAAVPSSLRMAFSPGGTLYYLPDTRDLYTINTATGVATDTGVNIGTAAQITSGGDMAFNAAGTLYISTSSKTIFSASIATGTATQIGNAPVNFTPSANATIGLAFNSSDELLAQTQSPNNIYRIPLGVANNATPQGILVRAGDGDTGSTGDMASASVLQPNLSITKTDNLTSVYRGGPVRYIITVTNNGTYPVTGTVVDNVPATVTGVTWTCAATLPSFCGAASGSGSINTTATLSPGASATYTFTAGTLSAAASGTLVNTATVSVPGWLADSNPADNTATDSDTIELNANLAITKTDGVANVTAGNVVTYTIVVSNAGPDASVGSVVTDNVPAAVTSVTWTCGTPTAGATCGAASGSGNAISTTANLPSGSTLRYTVTGTLSVSASGTLTNTATIITPAGVSDPTDLSRTGAGNNSATDTDTVTAIPYVKPQKDVSPSGPSQPPGTILVYTITFTNVGGAPAQSLVITDPFSSATDFKLGSETHAAPVAVNVDYWDVKAPGPPQWVTTPTSDGIAPAGYARNITKIRWTFAANLAPGASATLTFSVRIP
jgi:uncharacterized repeat protein (TIGR01451 family)